MTEKWVYEPGKDGEWREYKLRVAIGFPDVREVGMSNLGFLWVYHLINRLEEVRCDRFFAANRQLKGRERLTTVETGRSLSDYDVVAFSLPYEGGYPALPRILADGGIEPIAEKRNGAPFVIAGGMAASANPEPIADFLDAVVIGEAEPIIFPLIKAIQGVRRMTGRFNAAEMTKEAIRDIPGIYIPSDFEVVYGKDGTVASITRINKGPAVIEAVHAIKLDEPARSPVITDESAFPGSFLIEAARGCPFRCRFCLAGHAGGKFRPAAMLDEAINEGLRVTNRVGIIGTAFTKAVRLEETCRRIAARGASVSFSSVRLDEDTLQLFRNTGDALDLESISVAPEVASPKLAAVIGKDIASELDAFVKIKPLRGIKKLRLYFLIGVPGETDADVEAIADKVREIRDYSNWEVMASVTPMTPKPFTPMQWAGFAGKKVLERRKRLIEERLSGVRGVILKVESLRRTFEQATLSRGDRRMGATLHEAAMRGQAAMTWPAILKRNGVDPEFIATRARGEEEIFPWDMLSHGVSKETLYREYLKAMSFTDEKG
ncbi:MAG TPA: radical SAM protein [bacterium]|nr:radical SAM protein [bacterium]